MNEWAEKGCTNIVVTDAFGHAFSLDEFLAKLPLVRRMAEENARQPK